MHPDQVFDHLDYREFLAAFYRARKARPQGYSFRAFARQAGLRSPNYLKLVIDGERHLSLDMARRFGEACGLHGDSLDYFRVLVALARASSPDEAARCRKQLARFRHRRRIRPLRADQTAYHSKWYIPAVRELLACGGFRKTPARLASLLIPPITPAEAAHAIDVLLRLGLVTPDRGGRLVQTDALITTGAEPTSQEIANYHRMMIRHASESIARVPREHRDISSLTLAVGPATLARLKARVQALRRELLQLSAEETGPVQVVQLNLQLFPLTANATARRRRP